MDDVRVVRLIDADGAVVADSEYALPDAAVLLGRYRSMALARRFAHSTVEGRAHRGAGALRGRCHHRGRPPRGRSRTEIPDATTWVDVDATALMETRESLRSDADPSPGLLALLARFVLAGLAQYPVLNSRVDTATGKIHVFNGMKHGIAAQTDRGVVVPAVRHAHRLTTRQLGTEIRRLTTAARDGSATPAERSSGSFTLNNYGSFGVDGSAATINHPEVAILRIGRIIQRPWVVGGRVEPRYITTQLSLAFDHRVCDGGTAAGFIRFVAGTRGRTSPSPTCNQPTRSTNIRMTK